MALHSPHPNEMEFVAALSTVYHACLFLIKLGALRGTQIKQKLLVADLDVMGEGLGQTNTRQVCGSQRI